MLKKLYQLIQVKNGASQQGKCLCSSENELSIKHVFNEYMNHFQGSGFALYKPMTYDETLTLMIQVEEQNGMTFIEQLQTVYR